MYCNKGHRYIPVAERHLPARLAAELLVEEAEAQAANIGCAA